MKRIKFGTDGWRGIIAGDFTFENVALCTQAIANFLRDSNPDTKKIVIGHDTRFASEDFAQTAAEVLAANGIPVFLCSEATPTPVLSFATVHLDATIGISITASHNPPKWNGLKIRIKDGSSAPDEMVNEIERGIDRIDPEDVARISLNKAKEKGLLQFVNPKPDYLKRISELVDLNTIQNAGLAIGLDPMYGAASDYLKELIDGKNRLIQIHSERNPIFPGMKQPEPIGDNLIELSTLVKQEKLNVGLANDGDGDRLGVIDEEGNFIDQLQTFALLALYFLEVRKERGSIIKTITTTSMLYKLGEMFGVPIYETKVGFKYVAPLMRRENALLGGEESGGYAFRYHLPERDGILAALYFLDLIIKKEMMPSRLRRYLVEKVGPHYYHRLDVEFPQESRDEILRRLSSGYPQRLIDKPVIKKDTLDGFRFTLDSGAWLLIRFSGTEPLLRIYAEAESEEQALELTETGKLIAGV